MTGRDAAAEAVTVPFETPAGTQYLVGRVYHSIREAEAARATACREFSAKLRALTDRGARIERP